MPASPLSLSRFPFRSLLVATDMSPSAEAALARAFHLPLTPDATIHLLHVAEGALTPDLEQGRQIALHHAVKRSLGTAPHVNTVPALLRGDPAIEIDLHARLVDAELLVVGRGGPANGGGVGPTTTAVLAAVDRPVLVVGAIPPEGAYQAPLVAVDLDLVSADLLVLTSRVVRRDLPEVRLLHAFAASFEGRKGLTGTELNRWGEKFQKDAQARLDEIVAALPGSSIAWRTQVAHGDPAAVVRAQARQLAADLIVLGTHQRTGLTRWLAGSVADEVLQSVACDVLILPVPNQERGFPPRLPLSSQQA